jgi:glycosyltransferase involved in cell wall biosynthesis
MKVVTSTTQARVSGPRVSIGMPVYNGERHMRSALDSLLAQDHDNFELVISENGSTDGTRAICREYAERDPRVRVEHQRQHVSALENFRAVLALARGDYFMWAAVDDSWYPAFVRKAVDELERNPDAGVAMSAIDRVWDTGEPMDRIRFVDCDDVNRKGYYATTKGVTSTKKYNLFIYGLFRTELIKEAMRFTPEVPAWDRLVMCQIALATRFRYVDSVLHTRMHHKQPSVVRLPDEPFNRLQREARWLEVKILSEFARMLVRSSVVPWRRKLYAPVILSRYGWILARGRIAPLIKERVAPRTWQRLAPLRRLFVRR